MGNHFKTRHGGDAVMAESNIGTVVVNVMPILDDEAFDQMAAVIAEKVRIAVNRAIRDAVQVTIAERIGGAK